MPGRGPRGSGRTPIASGYGSTRIFRGKILSVDKVKHTVTVQGENNELHEGIACMPKYMSGDGTGSFLTPEVNGIVWLCTPSSDATPFILGHAVVPKQTEAGDDNEDPNDYRMNRPVLNEGDEMVASRDSGYIIMRKGGMLEVAASQMARTFWIPVENLIQSFCENFVVDTPGGSLSMLIRDEDETWGADKSPMEFQLGIKEFANDEFDIFDLRVGRIAAEDDTFIPIAGGLGQIVARLVINRHFIINIDKDGNFLRTLHGTDIENIEGSKFSTVQKTFQQIVKGLHSHIGKDRSVALDGSDSLTVGVNRTVDVQGSVTETIGGALTRSVTGKVTETSGEIDRTVQGAVNEVISGPANENVGGSKSLGAGENLNFNAAGKMSVTVANGQFAAGELTGLEIVLTLGELHIVDQLGTIILAAGGLAFAAVGRILIKPTGAIIIQNALGVAAEFELNATGIKLKTPAGSITLDAKGSVGLGPPGGGAVVTTLTHPVDYITGAPILGSSSVSAGGIPSIVAIPPVFVPDLS